MTDVMTFETTKSFTKQFKEVKRVALSGGTVELREGNTVFIFTRKPGTGGFLGAMKGQIKEIAPLEQLLSTGEKWEADA